MSWGPDLVMDQPRSYLTADWCPGPSVKMVFVASDEPHHSEKQKEKES